MQHAHLLLIAKINSIFLFFEISNDEQSGMELSNVT